MGWQDERLTAKEREILGKIVDDLRPDLRPLLDDVLGQRLLEDNELAAFEEVLDRVWFDSPRFSQNWLAADHLLGRVNSQARSFWEG